MDLHGHGTHCAGTVGSSTFGVAKQVSLVGVKIFNENGSGSIASVMSGCNWVYEDYEQKMIENGGKRVKAVASMSFSFKNSSLTIMDMIVNEMVELGIIMASSAANNNEDACK